MFRTLINKFYPNAVLVKSLSSVMQKQLNGKVAVITASTDGIGFAIAKRLALDGAAVIISSRKEQNVLNAIKKLKSEGISEIEGTVCHVAKGEDRKKLFKLAKDKFGGIDILISNAAANPTFGSVFDCSDDAWDKIFEVNVKAAFLLTKEVIPYMKERRKGSIIYISSIAGFVPINPLGAYSVSKTALLGLTKVCALELASENIRVNCIAPGIVKTKFSEALTGKDTDDNQSATSYVPIGRFAQPDDIGGIASFLSSDDASYITGESVVVAGGMQSRL